MDIELAAACAYRCAVFGDAHCNMYERCICHRQAYTDGFSYRMTSARLQGLLSSLGRPEQLVRGAAGKETELHVELTATEARTGCSQAGDCAAMGMANGQDLSSGLARRSAGSRCRLCTCFLALRNLLRLHGLPLAAAPCLACLQPGSRGASRPPVRRCSLHTTMRYPLQLKGPGVDSIFLRRCCPSAMR